MAFGLRSRPKAPEQEVNLDLTPLGARQPVSSGHLADPVQVSRIFLEPEEELRRRIKLRQTPKPLLMLILTYTLGGIAPAVLDMGRRRFTWAFLTLLSAAVWGATLWKWPVLRQWMENGQLPLLPCMVALGVVTMVAVQAWSRAVWLAADDVRFVPERLPGLLRRPASIALVGALLPGAGYLMAKHARRAAAVVWLMGPTFLAALTLWQAVWFWNVNRASGVQGLPLQIMELIFLVSVGVLLLGTFVWVTSAFDAARLAAFRAGQRASARADWLGFAVIAVMAIFFATLAPEKMARNLDQMASGMRHDGYRIIPLGMQHAAMRLDPSRPRYVMRAAELHDLMNQPEAASELREQLRTRWQEYAEFLLRQEAEINLTVPLRPIGLTESEEGSTEANP